MSEKSEGSAADADTAEAGAETEAGTEADALEMEAALAEAEAEVAVAGFKEAIESGEMSPAELLDAIDVLFVDVDETLIDRSSGLYAFYQEIAAELGMALPSKAEMYRIYGNASHTDILMDVFGISKKEARAYEERLEESLKQHEQHIKVLHGVPELFRYLKGLGKKIGVISNASDNETWINLGRIVDECARRYPREDGAAYTYKDLVDYVALDNAAGKKPSPDGITLGMLVLNREAKPAAMLGNSVLDVEAGKAAGIATIATRYTDPDIGRSCPDYVVGRTADVAKAAERLYNAKMD